jgi:hypothetical protein
VSCSILFSHYLLTSGIRGWYEIRLKKKLGFQVRAPLPPPFVAERICWRFGGASLQRVTCRVLLPRPRGAARGHQSLSTRSQTHLWIYGVPSLQPDHPVKNKVVACASLGNGVPVAHRHTDREGPSTKVCYCLRRMYCCA